MATESLPSEESGLMAGTSLVEAGLSEDSTIQQNRKLMQLKKQPQN